MSASSCETNQAPLATTTTVVAPTFKRFAVSLLTPRCSKFLLYFKLSLVKLHLKSSVCRFLTPGGLRAHSTTNELTLCFHQKETAHAIRLMMTSRLVYQSLDDLRLSIFARPLHKRKFTVTEKTSSQYELISLKFRYGS